MNRQVIERAPLRLPDDERGIGPRRDDDCRCSLSANAHTKRAGQLHRLLGQIENAGAETDSAACLQQLIHRLLYR